MMTDGKFTPITLYKRDNRGKIREWSIGAHDYEIFMAHGVLNGELQEVFDYIEKGMASRTRDEQLVLEINSKIKKRIDKGYVYSLDEAEKHTATNALGHVMPMLAQKFKDQKEEIDPSSLVYQYKYNGHRCLTHNDNKGSIAYSKNGLKIETVNDLVNLINGHLPVGKTLDGELYRHGFSLQKIGSWVRKLQFETSQLIYVVYDYISDEDFSERYKRLIDIVGEIDSPRIILAPVFEFTGSVKQMLNTAIDVEKYEGLIARRSGFPYEADKRSKSLLKIKRFEDGEYIITDIVSSKDGWALLWCMFDNGKMFSVTCPGPVDFKQKVLRESDLWRGATVNVEYANLTDDGKPFHPVATSLVNRQFD